MATLQQRDHKGIYKQTPDKQTQNVVGLDIPFIPPADPDLLVDNTGTQSIDEIADLILQGLKQKYAHFDLTMTYRE